VPTTRGIIVLRKVEPAGRPVRQIELCERHAQAVIAREREAGWRSKTGATGGSDIG
jgi:hypothetical protein